MSLFSIISQMLVLLLTGYLIILKQVSIGSISSVGQISGNIFNSLTTFNQLQVSISSVNIIFENLELLRRVPIIDILIKILKKSS